MTLSPPYQLATYSRPPPVRFPSGPSWQSLPAQVVRCLKGCSPPPPVSSAQELRWWRSILLAWPGHSLLQPSPLMVEYVWTDASKWGYGAHLGLMQTPTAAFSREVPRRHRSKDICFLEALAVLEALRAFSLLWTGPRLVVLYIDNTNVESGLRTGHSRDPLTQTLLCEIFGLCFLQQITLRPVRVASEDNHLADLLSHRCFCAVQQRFPLAHQLLFSLTPTKHPKLLLPPLAAQHSQPPTSGEDLLNPAANAALVSLTATEPLSTSALGQVHPPFQPRTCFSPSGLATWHGPALSTASSTSSMPCSPGTSTSASTLMDSLTAGWNEQFEASSAHMAFDQLLPSSPSPSPFFGPSSSSSGPCLLVPGTVRSSPQPLLSPLPVSFDAARLPGTSRRQLSCWSGPSRGKLTTPYSSRRPRPIPLGLGPPLVVPKVGGAECPYAALRLLCPTVRRPDAPLFGLHDGYRPLTRLTFLQHLCLTLSPRAGHVSVRGALLSSRSGHLGGVAGHRRGHHQASRSVELRLLLLIH